MSKISKLLFSCVLALAIAAPLTVHAELEVSGFVDALLNATHGENAGFGMGAFEVDFAAELSKKVAFEGAIVVEDGEVGLGQTLADFKLVPEEILGVQVGLLDMPFGLDYQVFATPDRQLITPPLVTELMMYGGWGDVGVNLYGGISVINYNLYCVNGMGYNNGEDGIYGTGDEGEGIESQLTENNGLKTVGGRIGVLPIKDLELGVSYCQGPYLSGASKEMLSRIGGDIQFAYGFLEGKGEFVYGKEEIPAGALTKHSGFYIQLLGRPLDKVYGVIRYGSWIPGWTPEWGDATSRLTIGLGYNPIENVSIRLEGQKDIEEPAVVVDNDTITLQIVTSF